MPLDCLHIVFMSLVLNKLCYCLPAWGGFVRETDVCRINSLFRRAKRCGFTHPIFDFQGLCHHYDTTLFDKMRNESHCLSHLMPTQRTNCKSLRVVKSFEIPKCRTELYKNSFVPRILYRI